MPENKKDLIVLHGALGANSQFEKLVEKLNDQFEIHALNFEGHGGEKSEREFSIEVFSQNLTDYLKKNKLSDVFVFGYSMGGYVALNTSLDYPGFIKKIITLGTKFDWNPESAAKEVRMLDPEKIKKKVPHFAESLRKRHGKEKWEEVLEKTRDMMLNLGEGQALTLENFEKVDIPVKIMVGDMDKMVSLEESEQVAKWIPDAQFESIENTQHPIEKVDSSLLAEKIVSFLN